MTVHRYLLSKEGRRNAQVALAAAFPFLVHWGKAKAVQSIQQDGLIPRTQGIDSIVDAADIKAAFDGIVPAALCLSDPMHPLDPMQDGPWVQFAVQTRDLPDCVCLDWTLRASWRLPLVLLDDGQCDTPEAAFVEAFRRCRSVVVAEPIPADRLRIRLVDSPPDMPGNWPPFHQYDGRRVYVREV